MITVAVIERTAEGRNIITEEITEFLQPGQSFAHLIPQISVIPLSLQEIRFRDTPQICIVGQQMCEQTPQEIRTLKKLFPDCFIVARIPDGAESISRIDELLRYGADDTLTGLFTAAQFYKYVVHVGKAQQRAKQGTVILVDSGKGGVGITSLAAGLADVISLTDKRVALLDLDVETQDLSRFLRVRPLLNEHLDLLLSQQRPLLAEHVEQCLSTFTGNSKLRCITPPAVHHDFFSIKSKESQIFFSFLKMLDSIHDVVVIDAGAARGSLLEMLYRVSDRVVFAVNNDPATLHASVEKLQSMASRLGDKEIFTLVNNAPDADGLSDKVLKQEYLKLTGLSEEQWLPLSIPKCTVAKTWPGSGETILSLGKVTVAIALETLAGQLGFPLAERTVRPESSLSKNFSHALSKFLNYRPQPKLGGGERSLMLISTQNLSRPALPSPEDALKSASKKPEKKSAKPSGKKRKRTSNNEAADLVSAVELSKSA